MNEEAPTGATAETPSPLRFTIACDNRIADPACRFGGLVARWRLPAAAFPADPARRS